MSFSNCQSDRSFGPTVRNCRGNFDFTLTFEKIFFSIAPAVALIIICIPHCISLLQRHIIAKGDFLQMIKAAFIVVYAVLQISLVVLSYDNALFVVAASVQLVASLFMLIVSWLAHGRIPRTSIILNAYLGIGTLLDVAQSRSLLLAAVHEREKSIARTFAAATATKAVMLLAECQPKSRWIKEDANIKDSPEMTSGLYSLSTMFWLNQLFLDGYRKLLEPANLPALDSSMETEALGDQLGVYLSQHPTRGQRFGLFRAVVRVLAVPMILPVLPRAALVGFSLCQPFLINAVLDFLSKSAVERSSNTGYGLIAATVIIYVGIAASTALYRYYQERVLWMSRGALLNVIYKKTTAATSTSSSSSSSHDAAVLTLMSTDIERVRFGFETFHEFWACSIQIGVASWLLFNELGTAFVAPIVVVVVCMISIIILTWISGKWQTNWMEKIENRVGITSSMIAMMKHLKISGLAGQVEALIQKLRVEEIHTGSRWRMTIILSFVIGFTPTMVGPVVMFAFSADRLDVSKLFTSLSFLSLLTSPLSQIFQFTPPLLASFTCLGRIQAFLDQENCHDFRETDGSHGEKEAASIHIDGGEFGWEPSNPVLKGLNIQFPTSALTMIVGPVASGKSTLCKALLGDVPFHSGRVSFPPGVSRCHVGYCDQVTFLSNGSIRENILGPSLFNQERYDEVVKAVMLEADLRRLPMGDHTSVASNGIALSGGQKQRVAMARALYLETSLLIFDDVFSGLDAETRDRVFARVFGPDGLIQRRGATAILCTHWVQHLAQSDHIIVLGSEVGSVEQGTFAELTRKEGYVKDALPLTKYEIMSASNIAIAGTISGASNVCDASSSTMGTSSITGGSGCKMDVDTCTCSIHRIKDTSTSRLAEALPAELAEPAQQIGDWQVYKHYAKSMKLAFLAGVLVLNVAVGFSWNFPQVWLDFWSADMAMPRASHSEPYWAGIYALLQIGCLACVSAAAFVVLITINAQSGTALHHEALRTVVGAPLRFFTETDAGIVTNLFSQDLSLIDMELPLALLNLMISIFVFIGMACIIATASPYIVISYPILLGLLWAIQKVYLRTSRQLRLLDLETKSPLYTHFTDTVTGITTLRALGWIRDNIRLSNKLVNASQQPSYLLAMVQHWLTFVLYMMIAALATLVLILTTQTAALTGSGFTGATLVTLMGFGDMISSMLMNYTEMETSIGAISRLLRFSQTVAPETRQHEDVIPPDLWPQKGAVSIQGVTASYNSSHLALNQLTIEIKHGQKVALCGRSGSGKSSVMLLLLKLLDMMDAPTKGSIVIDEISLERVDRDMLRQRVIALPQDPVFLPSATTVKANLDSSDSATNSECRGALEAVHLWPLMEAKGGLHATMMTEALSQGQKQLFSLARAIVRHRVRVRENHIRQRKSSSLIASMESLETMRAKDTSLGGILLLDEINSSTDKETDERMQAVIRQEFAHYTVIMVSHRLDVVLQEFDQVLVMEQGAVVESGHPKELFNQSNSKFKELWTKEQR